ncbi:MAG: hypothetical protein S4CHLAM37_04140 [Chlamydiia bacterium]|nr:hypothetical protein [Chlamydiia bacterium]
MVHVPCIGQVSGTKMALVTTTVAIGAATVYCGGPEALINAAMPHLTNLTDAAFKACHEALSANVSKVVQDLPEAVKPVITMAGQAVEKLPEALKPCMNVANHVAEKLPEATASVLSAAQQAAADVVALGKTASPSFSYNCGILDAAGVCSDACKSVALSVFSKIPDATAFVCGELGCIKV